MKALRQRTYGAPSGRVHSAFTRTNVTCLERKLPLSCLQPLQMQPWQRNRYRPGLLFTRSTSSGTPHCLIAVPNTALVVNIHTHSKHPTGKVCCSCVATSHLAVGVHLTFPRVLRFGGIFVKVLSYTCIFSDIHCSPCAPSGCACMTNWQRVVVSASSAKLTEF